MNVTNTPEDFARAELLAKEYNETVAELYLVQAYALKRECAAIGNTFDSDQFDSAFRRMIASVLEETV